MPRNPDSAADLIPNKPTITSVRKAATDCRACDLWKRGTQTVFGEGGGSARLMLVGEQPGDQEDLQGHPFVGPAGNVLQRALEEAGISRKEAYATNVVKHFKWVPTPGGKRRLHSKPSSRQIQACRPWLEEELRVVKPRVLVLLGATAAQSLLGGYFRVTQARGKVITSTPWAPAVVATVHPSSILRDPNDEERHRQYELFVQDLQVVA